MAGHPYYFAEKQEDVKRWVLNLKVTDKLFAGGVVPKGVDNLKGQRFEVAFKKIKDHYKYYRDVEGDEQIRAHLDALLVEVNNLKEGIESQRSNRKTHQATTGGNEGKDEGKDEDKGEDKDAAATIISLRNALALANDTIRNLEAEANNLRR